MLTLYRCLLYLYPKTHRREFAEEMCSVFDEARLALPQQFANRAVFYVRELAGLVAGAFREHIRTFMAPVFSFRRFDMQPQFRFPRATVFLMLVIFAGVVLTIAKATSVQLAYGNSLGSVWPSLVSILILMLLTMCAAAAIGWSILHALRRTGVHRLADLQTGPAQK